MWLLPNRGIILFFSLVFGFFTIALLTFVFGKESMAAFVFLDRNPSPPFVYPFTIQNLMTVFLFIGFGELFVRWRISTWENNFLLEKFLPEDEETVLQSNELGTYRKRVRGKFDGENGFLPSLLDLCILQFQSSKSVDQVVSVLNSSLELIMHRVDLRYSMIRFLVWVIPTIGFIGTVVGIALTLASVNPESPDFKLITITLGLAFNTTLVALIYSSVLVFIFNVIQAKEEKAVNNAGQYVLKNLINRLYNPN